MKQDKCTKIFIFIIFLGLFAFHTILISKIYNFDGMVYALQLKAAAAGQQDDLALYSPYHMLYLPLALFIYKAVKSLGLLSDPLSFLQAFNLVLGYASLILFYVFCRKRFSSAYFPMLAVLLLGFSFSFWFMAHEAETYILTLAIVFLLLLALFDYKPGVMTNIKAAVIGLLLGLAVLGHITTVIMVFPVLYYLIKRLHIKPSKIILMLAMTLLIIFLEYFLFYLRSPSSSLHDLRLWFFQATSYQKIYGVDVNFWEFGLTSIPQTLISTFDAFVTKFNYAKLDTAVYTTARAVTALLLIIVLIPLFKNFKKYTSDRKFLTVFSLTWFIPFTIFYAFWGVSHFKFRVLTLPALILLTIGSLQDTGRAGRIKKIALPVILISALFIFNTYVSFIPASTKEKNLDLLKAEWIRDMTPHESVIIILGLERHGYEFGKVYIPYFSERKVLILNWNMSKNSRGDLQAEILLENPAAKGLTLFALNEVFDDIEGREKLAAGHKDVSKNDLVKLFALYEHIPFQSFSKDFYLYRLVPKISDLNLSIHPGIEKVLRIAY